MQSIEFEYGANVQSLLYENEIYVKLRLMQGPSEGENAKTFVAELCGASQ